MDDYKLAAFDVDYFIAIEAFLNPIFQDDGASLFAEDIMGMIRRKDDVSCLPIIVTFDDLQVQFDLGTIFQGQGVGLTGQKQRQSGYDHSNHDILGHWFLYPVLQL